VTTRLNRVSPYLLLTLTMLFWSGNVVLARAMRAELPPIALAFWRWTIAFCVLAPFAWREAVAAWPIIRQHWKILLVLGTLATGGYNSLAYLGLQYTTATNAVLINCATPAVIALIAAAARHEHLARHQWAGIVVSAAGVLYIVMRGEVAALAKLQLNLGDAWIVASVLAWAVYSILLKLRPAGIGTTPLLLILIVLGFPLLIPLYAGELQAGRNITLTPGSLAALAYVGVVPSVIAYLFWNQGVARVGPTRAGLFMNLMPVFGALLSIAFLGERLQGFQLLGIGLIFSGIYLTTRGRPVHRPALRE